MTQRTSALRAAEPLRSSPPVAELRARRGLPRLPRAYVEPDSVRTLASADLPPMVVLQAPRAFGKTAAVSWLLRQQSDQQYDHVWVTPQPRGVTAAELWETVSRRLRDVGLEDSDWASLNRLMARRRRRLVLVVDDLDRVADTSVDDELAELVRNHDQLHVIAMSRHLRPIQMAATQVDGVRLAGDDLRLDDEDVLRLARNLGRNLDPTVASELRAQLRGWPALLRLALEEPVRTRGGDVVVDQGVVDRYVRQQLADVPDERIRRAFEVLAVPQTLTVELASALVGEHIWANAMAFVADTGFGDHEVMGRGGGPDPVRTAGATVFAEDAPAEFRDTSLRVARWYAARSQPAAALRHAVDAEAWDLVAELLRENWATVLAEHPALTRGALERLPAASVSSDARLLVARDYVLNVSTEDRARAAFAAGLLLPDGASRARGHQRLTLRQVLTLQSSGLYDIAHTLIENRDLSAAIEESGWSAETVRGIPGLLLDWAVATVLGDPGIGSTYAFCEAAAWADHLDDAALRADAAAGAALSHVVCGYPNAALAWLAQVQPETAPTPFGAAVLPLTRALVDHHVMKPPTVDPTSIVLPPELADLEALVAKLRADALLRSGRDSEAVRLLEGYRVRHPDGPVISLAEHALVNAMVETYLSGSQVERARRLLLEVDPEIVGHQAAWALVSFQSGEYEQVLAVAPKEELVPRQTLQLALLRACAALRLQQRAVALDSFQTAVSTATQTGMLRPFALIPQSDLRELAGDDVQVAELLSGVSLEMGLLAEPQDGSGLSPRELQVLETVATGAPFAAVASRLFVSPNTVKSQMRDIYRKLGVRGREQAVDRARELGLLRR